MGRPVARGVLIREEHIETLKRLPNKTMDAVLGAAFRVAIGEMGALAVKDQTGILDAVVQSIAIAALKFDEKEKERMARDAEAHSERRKREKKALCLLDGGRQEQTETDKNQTKADKKRTGADKSGIVLKERRKEGKNIYTPKSPKGNLRFPPEVDLDAMFGEGGGRDGARPSQDGGNGDQALPQKEEGEPSEEVTVAEVAARMEARHPNPAGTDSFPRSLVRYLKKNGGGEGGMEGLLGEIEASHRRWIESGAWDEEDGRYAPQLKNWLWGGGWKKAPPEKKRARREEDADDFHAGASL